LNNILLLGINISPGPNNKKNKGFYLAVFEGDEWKLLGLKLILEACQLSYGEFAF
jgi:G:T/U-mismatch repair DNA glycosylase